MKRIPTFIVNYSVKANNSKHLVHIVNKFLEAYKQNWKIESNKNRRGKSQLKVHEIKTNYEADSHGQFFHNSIPNFLKTLTISIQDAALINAFLIIPKNIDIFA